MGKLIASFFGLMLGSALNIGLFGFTFGLWVGHQFDEALRKNVLFWQQVNTKTKKKSSLPVLYQHLFNILGHVAKSDGLISEEEIKLTNEFMSQLNIRTSAQKADAQKAFNRGKRKDFSIQMILMQVQLQLLLNPQIKDKFVHILAKMKLTDQPIHPNKARLIDAIHQQLNVSFQYNQGRQQQYNTSFRSTANNNDYETLGVDRQVNKDDLKKAYRRLMHKHHPDRLTAQGASEAEIKQATKTTQGIKNAYERICQAKGF